jgi:hypothetical protein
MPTPGILRAMAGFGEAPAEERADMAFAALRRAVGRVGHWSSPSFDDPLLNATVRNLGGWLRVCDLDIQQFETWYRKDFLRIYAMFSRASGLSKDDVAPLLGDSEAENVAKGYTGPEHASRVQVRTGLPWAGPAEQLSTPSRLETITD